MATTSYDVMDEFAARAMQAILTDLETYSAMTRKLPESIIQLEGQEALAQMAYDIAAAMMTERAKRRRSATDFNFTPNTGPIT
jgi:hypothetical protein